MPIFPHAGCAAAAANDDDDDDDDDDVPATDGIN